MRLAATIVAAAAASLSSSAAPLPPTPQMQADAAALVAASAAAGSTAWDKLAYVADTFGPRFSGSDALNATISWIAADAAAQPGLRVTWEPVTVPRWVRGDEWATLDSPRSKALHFCGLGYSTGTPFGAPLTADVLVVANYSELQAKAAQAAGKIVLFDWTTWEGYGNTVTYRVNAATWAASVGAVGALIKSISPWGIQTCHTGGSVPAAVAAGAVSREDSMQMRRMQERGQRVVVTMAMPATLLEPRLAWNLLIDYTAPGAENPDELVIVSGHMDRCALLRQLCVRARAHARTRAHSPAASLAAGTLQKGAWTTAADFSARMRQCASLPLWVCTAGAPFAPSDGWTRRAAASARSSTAAITTTPSPRRPT